MPILGRTNPQSLLVDALMVQGIALAQLGKAERAKVALEKAIAIALQLGAMDKAGLAALTMIEELEELPPEALITNYDRASIWLQILQASNCCEESTGQPIKSSSD